MKKVFACVTAAIALSLLSCAGGPASTTSGGSSASYGTSGSDVTASSNGAVSPTASTGTAQKGLSGVPAFVNEAYLQASEDVLVGVGTYKIGADTSKLGAAKAVAETRARADLSRQLETIVKNMIIDYTAMSELDPDAAVSFQENITLALSKSDLKGSVTKKMDTVDGVLWVVMEYGKSAAAQELDAAQAAAKLAVPAAIAFNALDRMDTAFNKEAAGGPIPVGD